MTDRDLTKTLPGTGPTPLIDGDAVATILRDLVIGVDELGKGLHAKLDMVGAAALASRTSSAPPAAPPSVPAPAAPAAPPPSQPPAASKRQVAAATAAGLAKWGTFAIGVLAIAAQIAKVWRPSLVAPLDQALDLLHQATGQK